MAASVDRSFTITSLDAFHLVVPDKTYWSAFRPDNRASSGRFLLKPGWRTVYAEQVETAVLRVGFADGSFGWGEVTEPICPEIICKIAAELIAPLAGGIEFADPEALWDFAYDLNRCRGHVSGYQCLALGALDTAVWDAIGRREGRPVANLIGSEAGHAVSVYLSGIRRATREERVAALQAAAADGLTAAKIFIDADVEEAARELAALRGAVMDSFALATDALWSFETVAAASAARSRLAEWDVAWLECPMIPEDLAAHVALKAAPGVPIALGEHFSTHYQSSPWLAAKVLDIFQPDISRTGISDGLRQQREAVRNGIRVTPHMGTGSPIVQAIALSFGAATAGDMPCEYQHDLAQVLPDVFDSGWVYDRGGVPVPDRPGLGVEVNAEKLGRYSASVQSWQAR